MQWQSCNGCSTGGISPCKQCHADCVVHYHSRHTEGVSARSRLLVPSVPILSNSTSLPDHAAPPQSPSAAGTMAFDRMEADIKALQQQALATQTSIQQLQSRPQTDPLTSLLNDAPALPSIDTTVVSAVVVLAAALALVWWYLWQRPKVWSAHEDYEHLEIHSPANDLQAQHEPEREPEPEPLQEPKRGPMGHHEAAPTRHAERLAQAVEAEPGPSARAPLSPHVFARVEAPVGFDSEAAANEVTRVRKSLAEKREARTLMQERGEESFMAPLPSIEPATDSHWDASSVSAPDVFLAMAEDPVPEEEPECEPEQPPGPDFTIILALAQESESLDMWPEARELATEVLETTDPTLREQALALLQRITSQEQKIAQDLATMDIEL